MTLLFSFSSPDPPARSPDPPARSPDPPARSDPCADRPGPLVVIEVEVSPDQATVVITGELDLTTQAVLAEHLSLALGARPRRLVVDLAGTGFMDCASARVIACARQFLPDGSRLIIRHPSRAVRRVLELTGFGAGCEIEDE
jgi:anti-sigma B factor antagonist